MADHESWPPDREDGGVVRRPWGFGALLGSVLGTALQLQQPALWPGARYALLLALCVLGLAGLHRVLRRRSPPAALVLAAALVLGACGGAGLAGWRAAHIARSALDPALEGADLRVTGVVAQMPQRSEAGLRFRLDVESALDASGEPVRLPPTLGVAWYAQGLGDAHEARAPGPAVALHAGERWRLMVRLKAPHGSLNPHGFDTELWLWEQGVQASGYVRSGKRDAAPERLGATWQHPVERAREAVRDAVFERVADARQAGVIAALITGDQAAIERGDWDVFRTTGVAHLMSISGLHVTMFAWLAAWAVGALWRRSPALMLRWPTPHAALLGGVLLAALYALFSGWGVPSQRTVCMLATVAALRLSGLRWPWPHVWLCACAVVVGFDPWALMQAGFWLSFVAVGVLFATDSGARSPEPMRTWGRFVQIFREQWVVTLALTPLTLLLFQQASVVGLLANAVAIPWVTLVVTPLAMLGVALHPLWQGAAWAVWALGVLLQWLAAWPWAAVSMPAPPLWAAVGGVAGGALVAMRLPWSVRLLGVPLLLPVLLWQAPRPAAGEFDLLAADIGQGNAVLVRTATHSLLYDAGPRFGLDSDAGQRVLVPLLRALGERLDLLVLSHRDSDHTGGAAAVLAMQPGAELLSSIEDAHPLQGLRPARRCEAGQRWVWDGVDFEVLHPMAQDYAGPRVRPNALSCVLRIGNGRAAVLLAGDVERQQEAALAGREPDLRADLLLAPHHGSKTSSSDALLDAVRPRMAWVQAGYRNRFGHPAAEVVRRYEARGIALVDSPHCGAIQWQSSHPGAWQCERDTAQRYWHHRVP
jgi:competence protein ComEC